MMNRLYLFYLERILTGINGGGCIFNFAKFFNLHIVVIIVLVISKKNFDRK